MPLVFILWPIVQIVQFVQDNALTKVEYVPDTQLLHTRSEMLVPLVVIL